VSEASVVSEPQQQPATDAVPAVPPPPAPPARSRFSWLALLALVLALLALASVAALYYRDEVRRELAEFHFQSQLGEQAQAVSQLRQLLSNQRDNERASREQLLGRIKELQDHLEEQQQRIAALASTDRSDWQLAEAEYLLHFANQRLLLSGDPRTALEQLAAVDAILRELDDSELLPTRAALAKDIAALKAVEMVDTEGTYLTIAAAAEQAEQLHLVKTLAMTEATAPTPAPAEATWGERLQYGLRAALAKLDQLVQIRRRDEPYKPLLAPQYEAALRQNLKLMFEQAQMALLSGNQKLYEHSLSKAGSWIATYFTVDEHATRAVTDSIDELKKKRVAMSLPDISQSRREFKAYLNARRNRAAGTAP
jgi:uroporphyrin-III C-methyltransferase